MRSRTSLASIFAIAGALQPLWIFAWSIAFGSQRGGYDATHAISELGQQGSANAAAWNVVGFGGSALLYGLFSLAILREFGSSWLFRIAVLQAVALGASGVFSCDPGCPPQMTTWQGWAHTAVGLSYFAVTTVAPLVAWRAFRRRMRWRSRATVSLALGVLLVALFLGGPFIFGADRVGIYQRLTLALTGAWTLVVASGVWQGRRQLGRDGNTFAVPARAPADP